MHRKIKRADRLESDNISQGGPCSGELLAIPHAFKCVYNAEKAEVQLGESSPWRMVRMPISDSMALGPRAIR